MKRDPIESTVEYIEAMKKIQPILDAEFPEGKPFLGKCHKIWRRKKDLLLAEGITWKSPKEMNPYIIFD